MVQKTAEATGDLNGNKIDDQTTSAGKSKEDDKTSRRNLYSTIKKTRNHWWLKNVLIP